MARNRQRAADRKAARRSDGDAGLGVPDNAERQNVPDDWEHGSAEVDQAEAAIVAGAHGEESDATDAELEQAALASAPARRAPAAAPGQATAGGGIGRFPAFLRACWAELQRVQWPDRRQVGQATAVVIGFVIVAGAYLGLADSVAQRIVDFIL